MIMEGRGGGAYSLINCKFFPKIKKCIEFDLKQKTKYIFLRNFVRLSVFTFFLLLRNINKI